MAEKPIFRKKFAFVVFTIQLVFVILFAFFVDYDADANALDERHNNEPQKGGQEPKDNSIVLYASLFQDIHSLVFFGIGFLYAFITKYGYTGLGINMLLGALSIEWAIIIQNVWHMETGKIKISVISLITGEFAAASALIALGGVFGKISPLQMMVFTLFEVASYSINEHLCIKMLQVADLGEAVALHLFAGLFGLAAAFVADRKKDVKGNPNESTNYMSNLFCMLGTIFLWAVWPSFNSALAISDCQHRSFINTTLALISSCITAFGTSSFLNEKGKFTMTHIQNATLAGGVAIGTTTDLMAGPAASILIGAIAGCISVAGYKYVTPFLSKRLKIHDPCGINSLHAIPGFFAGIVGILATFIATESFYGLNLYRLYPAMAPKENSAELLEIQTHLPEISAGRSRTVLMQAVFQLIYLLITTAAAIVSGLITGFVLRISFFNPLDTHEMYLDEPFWETPQEITTNEEIVKNDTAITKC